MSYLRWSHSDWYIYWHSDGLTESKAPKDQQLAIWYGSHVSPIYGYPEIIDMINHNTFHLIPGFTEASAIEQQRCIGAIKDWVTDVHAGAP